MPYLYIFLGFIIHSVLFFYIFYYAGMDNKLAGLFIYTMPYLLLVLFVSHFIKNIKSKAAEILGKKMTSNINIDKISLLKAGYVDFSEKYWKYSILSCFVVGSYYSWVFFSIFLFLN